MKIRTHEKNICPLHIAVISIVMIISLIFSGIFCFAADCGIQNEPATADCGTQNEQVITDFCTDIDGHWAQASIEYVLEKNYMSILSEQDTFRPDDDMTRAMLVKAFHMIASYVENPAVMKASINNNNTENNYVADLFNDMTGLEDYAGDAVWAYEAGIINGIDGAFCGELAADRQTVSVMIFRLINYLGLDLEEDWSAVLDYNDLEQIADWAIEGIAYCTMTGLMNGSPDGNFMPTDKMTRAQAAVLIYNIDRKIKSVYRENVLY